MALEQELELALRYRLELLLGVATFALSAAGTDFDAGDAEGVGPAHQLAFMREAIADLARAEALTAVILTRVGVSWDVLASAQDQTRQALHRRLASKGQASYQSAQDYPHRYLSSEFELLRRFTTEESLDRLEAAPTLVASALMTVRSSTAWWRSE